MNIADSTRPLTGVRVLDMLVGPMAAATRQLVDLGADVIRLEPPGGAEDRTAGSCAAGIGLAFAADNLGKRATTLDQLERLVTSADILVAPLGSVEPMALRAKFPALVLMIVSDFGATGQFAKWQGSGPVFHALSGELSRSGMPEREPLLPPGDLAHACSAAQAAFLLLLAYWNRCRTGKGDHLDFSVLDGAAQAMDPGYGIAGSATAGVSASKLPRGRPEAGHQYPVLPCKDGFVRLCILSPRQWRGMFEWMGRPEEFADPAFEQIVTRFNSPTLLSAISSFIADKTQRQIDEQGQRHGVPAAAVLELSEALATDQMVARTALMSIELAPGVDVMFPNGAMEVDGQRAGIAGPPPEVVNAIDWHRRSHEVVLDGGGESPLSDLRVLDLGVIVVGAESGRLLGDHGAEVLKVETKAFPDGSRQNRTGGLISPTFAAGHRNKLGLGLNLQHPSGKALLLRLVEQSDVLLSNFKGGTLEALGLDYSTLKEINPRIIVTDSSAFGPTGPWSRRMGYGPLVRASVGLTHQWRYAGEPESFSDAITVYPDHVASRVGMTGVLALLIRRLRTGKGGSVSVSQAEVMLSHMASQIAWDSIDSGEAGQSPTSTIYRCAGDDEWCVVTVRDAIDEAKIADTTGGEVLKDWMSRHDPREAMEALQAKGVPAGAMLRVSELPTFAYYEYRHFFRMAHHPHLPDRFIVEGAPVRSEQFPEPPERPAPLPGEHTREIIKNRLGLSDKTIDALIQSGAIEQFTVSDAAEPPCSLLTDPD